MSDFYEEKLTQAGVRLEKNVTAERLWGLEEQARTPGAWQPQQSVAIIVACFFVFMLCWTQGRYWFTVVRGAMVLVGTVLVVVISK